MAGSSSVKIASSPINWWDDFPLPEQYKPSPEEVLGQMKEAGYAGTELGGTLPNAPQDLIPLLEEYELELVGGMFPTFFLCSTYDEQEAKFVRFVKDLAKLKASVVLVAEASYNIAETLSENIFSPRLPFLSTEQWSTLCHGLENFTQVAQNLGLKLGYHPHVGSVVIELWQIERLLEGAPDLSLALDTGHLAFAGVDPLFAVDRYMERIVHFHLKNIRPAVVAQARQEPVSWKWAKLNGVFTVPGDGGIDFPPILRKIEEAGYQGWLVLEAEQDTYRSNPFLYAKLGREYISEVTGW